MMKSAAVLLAGASVLALPGIATAQAGDEGVVVTGSRVIRNGNNSPTPVTVVVAEDMQVVQPSTIADNLNNLPVFSGSRNQYGNPNPAGGNGAANQLNLRNLGAQRSLILYDGHRVPPTLTNGTVDVDMIPQALIQRVDMVTGGVSAVYGSDAISGVVNFVTDPNFNGVKAHAQAGRSAYSDDDTYNIGAAFGAKLGERAHFEGSYEYRDDRGVLLRSSRPWNNQWAATGLGTAAFPYYLVPNVRLAQYAFGGLITSAGALNGQAFKQNGVLSAFQHGAATGSAGVEIGGDGAYYDDSLKAPLKSHQIFGRFDIDLTDSIRGYAVASANLKQNAQYLSPLMAQNVRLSSSNGFLAPAYRTALSTAGQTTFTLSEFLQQAPRRTPETHADQYFYNVGLEGTFGEYNWDASYVRGQTQQKVYTRNNVRQDYLSAALDAVVNPANGQVVCNVTLTNPGLYPNCVPLNLFGPNAASAEAIDYIHDDMFSTAHQTMDDAEVSVSGPLFNTWAGPIQAAASAEWRRLSFYSINAARDVDLANCTGLRFNCTQGTTAIWQNSGSDRAQTTQDVKEGALEVDVPLLKDVFLVQSLNINGAARFTSYSTSGDYTTWKVGLDWHLNDALSFRATKSRDIRAPTLDELFTPQTTGRQTSTDLLTGQTPTVPLYGGGNPNLQAEIGNTTTAGVVWRPEFIHGFSLSADGYYINIENALSSVMGTVAAAQQACYDSKGTSPFCGLQIRPAGACYDITNATCRNPANTIIGWRTIQINIANAKSYGVDLEANYSNELFGRRFSLRGFLNWQPHLYFNTPGLQNLDHAGVAYSTNALYPAPRVKTTLMLHYEPIDRLSVDVMEKWRSKMTMRNNPNHVWVNPTVDSVAYTSVNLAYDLAERKGQNQLFFNVQNLFNTDPPPAAFFSAQTQPGQFGGFAIGDDPIGRYYTVGIRVRY
jgi:outer membrane receptor protein involved in Fe transport